jgi:alpha-aminoadipate carrier protein LysW
MPRTRCPNCDARIKIARPRQGDVITCPDCGVELEVVNVDPLEVDLLDDWDDK